MSYYGRGTKELILTDLHTQISAISGIKFVDWQRVYDSSVTPERHPGCFINDVRTDKQMICSNIVRNIFTVGIVGWVWAGSNENLGTVMNTFLSSIETAIMTDQTRNSQAYSTSIEIIETDSGSSHPQGQFIMMLKILYFSSE